ncbi:MAG TPA: hypothetical protein VGX93_03675 [Chthoniobacterales bacterium]|nr:hypothetical protein [Chthoniobacterales bacterium]
MLTEDRAGGGGHLLDAANPTRSIRLVQRDRRCCAFPASDQSSFITGIELVVDGGMSQV